MPHRLTQPEEVEHVLMIMPGHDADTPDNARQLARDAARDEVTATERSQRDGYIQKSAHGLPDP